MPSEEMDIATFVSLVAAFHKEAATAFNSNPAMGHALCNGIELEEMNVLLGDIIENRGVESDHVQIMDIYARCAQRNNCEDFLRGMLLPEAKTDAFSKKAAAEGAYALALLARPIPSAP